MGRTDNPCLLLLDAESHRLCREPENSLVAFCLSLGLAGDASKLGVDVVERADELLLVGESFVVLLEGESEKDVEERNESTSKTSKFD